LGYKDNNRQQTAETNIDMDKIRLNKAQVKVMNLYGNKQG